MASQEAGYLSCFHRHCRIYDDGPSAPRTVILARIQPGASSSVGAIRASLGQNIESISAAAVALGHIALKKVPEVDPPGATTPKVLSMRVGMVVMGCLETIDALRRAQLTAKIAEAASVGTLDVDLKVFPQSVGGRTVRIEALVRFPFPTPVFDEKIHRGTFCPRMVYNTNVAGRGAAPTNGLSCDQYCMHQGYGGGSFGGGTTMTEHLF